MSIKNCVYLDCENILYKDTPSREKGGLTFFRFPKDPVRRMKWKELGRVSEKELDNNLLMCSEHFDKKYFSRNERRTVLVGPAIPFPYVEDENKNIESDDTSELPCEEVDEESRYVLYDDVSHENLKAGCSPEVVRVESTTPRKYEDCQLLNTEDESEPYNIVLETSNSPASKVAYSKRKPNNSVETPRKRTKTEDDTASSTSKINQEQGQLIDTDKVTIFIFKNEEYIQMSKQHYIQEKETFLKKIARYENIIRSFKELANTVDIE